LYFFWSSWTFGCSACIRRVAWRPRSVSGSVASRTRIVKAMIARPKLSKRMRERTINPLIIGLISTSFQTKSHT
jgi:hypothetical protein